MQWEWLGHLKIVLITNNANKVFVFTHVFWESFQSARVTVHTRTGRVNPSRRLCWSMLVCKSLSSLWSNEGIFTFIRVYIPQRCIMIVHQGILWTNSFLIFLLWYQHSIRHPKNMLVVFYLWVPCVPLRPCWVPGSWEHSRRSRSWGRGWARRW
jgi:hypothetical protein